MPVIHAPDPLWTGVTLLGLGDALGGALALRESAATRDCVAGWVALSADGFAWVEGRGDVEFGRRVALARSADGFAGVRARLWMAGGLSTDSIIRSNMVCCLL